MFGRATIRLGIGPHSSYYNGTQHRYWIRRHQKLMMTLGKSQNARICRAARLLIRTEIALHCYSI